MQEIRSSNTPVVTGICDPSKSRARHHRSYLTKRQQRVRLHSKFSTWERMISGVPQGSILGPLLFNIFLSDIFLFVENSYLSNYADDNT